MAVLTDVLATAADLFSVFADPTRALTERIERGEPSLLSDLLGLLMLLLPTFAILSVSLSASLIFSSSRSSLPQLNFSKVCAPE